MLKLCECGHEEKCHDCTLIDYTGKEQKLITETACNVGDCLCEKFKLSRKVKK